MRQILLKLIVLCAAMACGPAVHAAAETETRAEMKGIGSFTIPAWFKDSFLDLRDDIADATGENKRVMLYFHQDGCPYCAELVNNNFSQKELVDYLRANFQAIDMNMWGDREVVGLDGLSTSEKAYAAKLKVWFTPTILFFDEKGEVALRINGYYPPHQFLAALKYVAEKQEGRQSFREYYAKTAPPASKGELHAEPLFAKPPHDFTYKKGAKPLAVFFEQKDCSPCDRLHEKVFPLPATQEQLKRFTVVQLDRWGTEPVTTPEGQQLSARAWTDELNISYVPSVVLFDEGREVIRMEALLKAFHVQSVLDYAASGAYKTQPSLQRFLQHRAEHLREQGIVVDLWKE